MVGYEPRTLSNGGAARPSLTLPKRPPAGAAAAGEHDVPEPGSPSYDQVSTFLSDLETAAAAAVDGGPDCGEAVAKLLRAVAGVRDQVNRFSTERSGLKTCVADALKQAESLAAENVELRRMGEDALLDKQLQRAQSETEKLAAAAENYKRDLLRQRAADAEHEVATLKDRLKESVSDNEKMRELVRDLRSQLRSGAAPTVPTPAGDGDDGPAPLSAKEREELAVRLLASEGKPLDAQILVMAAKGLRDTAVLEAHLQSTIQEKERLALNVDELNDIVFSKTFQPPSAWADRERKYKMEKRDWETDLARLRDQMGRLREENRKYREVNRAAEFEAATRELREQLSRVEADKVTALKEVHELKMKLRRNDGEFTSDGKRSPYRSPFSATGSTPTKATRPPDASAASSPEVQGHSLDLCPDTEVQATISGLEKAGVGTQVPTKVVRYEAPKVRVREAPRPLRRPDAFATTYADGTSGRTSPSMDGASSAPVRSQFEGAGIHPEAPRPQQRQSSSGVPQQSVFADASYSSGQAQGAFSAAGVRSELNTARIGTQAPRPAAHADSATPSQREAIVPDASYGSGPRPDTFDVSTGDVRSRLDAAGIGPQVPMDPARSSASGELREAISADASYGSGPRPETMGASTAALRSGFDAAGVAPQAPVDMTRRGSSADGREAVLADASYGSGPRPDQFAVSTAGLRSELDAAGVAPQAPHDLTLRGSAADGRENISADASYASGQRPAEFGSTADLRSELNAAGVAPRAPQDLARRWSTADGRESVSADASYGSGQGPGEFGSTAGVRGQFAAAGVGMRAPADLARRNAAGKDAAGPADASYADGGHEAAFGVSTVELRGAFDAAGRPLDYVGGQSRVANGAAPASQPPANAYLSTDEQQEGASFAVTCEPLDAAGLRTPDAQGTSGEPTSTGGAENGAVHADGGGPQPFGERDVGSWALHADVGSHQLQGDVSGHRLQREVGSHQLPSGRVDALQLQGDVVSHELPAAQGPDASVPGIGDVAAEHVGTTGQRQPELLLQAATQPSRDPAGQVSGDGGAQQATGSSQHRPQQPPQSDQRSAEASAASGKLSPPTGVGPAAAAPGGAATGLVQLHAEQHDAGGETRGTIQLSTDEAAALGADADRLQTLSSPAHSSTRTAAAVGGDPWMDAEPSLRGAARAMPETGEALAATSPLARAPSLSEGMAGTTHERRSVGGEGSPVPAYVNGNGGASMDGLLQAYSAAAGSPQSPTMGQPGEGDEDIALLDIGELAPELEASLVTLQLTVDQQAEHKVIAALRLAEPSWHHHPATAGRDDGGGRESFDGRGGRDEPGGGDVGGPVRIGSEREELYKMYSDHIESEDVGALKWQKAELESRNEMYQAQLMKAQKALERSDQDKAKLEQDLAAALAASAASDKSTLMAMRERLAGLVNRRSAREEETDEKLKETAAALQAAYRERQVLERRAYKLEKQLSRLSAALGPAAVAAVVEASENGSETGDELDSRAPSGHGFNFDGVLHGLSEDDMDIMRLREENEVLMNTLVRSKLEMAETQSDYVKTKRALIRAVEKQAEMEERMDLLKAELECNATPPRSTRTSSLNSMRRGGEPARLQLEYEKP